MLGAGTQTSALMQVVIVPSPYATLMKNITDHHGQKLRFKHW